MEIKQNTFNKNDYYFLILLILLFFVILFWPINIKKNIYKINENQCIPTICSQINSKISKIIGNEIKTVYFYNGEKFPFSYKMIIIPKNYKSKFPYHLQYNELLNVGDSIIKESGKNNFIVIRDSNKWEFEFYNHYHNLCTE